MNDEPVKAYTDLMARIAFAHPQLQGWCELDKAQLLAALVLSVRMQRVLEIGIYGGKSLIPMAMALREIGHAGIIIGIDPWKADESAVGQDKENAEWWAKLDHEQIYQSFYRGLHREGVSEWVRVERKRSDDYLPDAPLDLLHTDGNHGEQALRDTQRYAPFVRVGGFCCLDDLGWSGGAVQRSADWLLANGFIELYKLGTGAMYQRVEKQA